MSNRDWVTVKKAEAITGLPATFFDERTGASGVWPEGTVWKWFEGRKLVNLVPALEQPLSAREVCVRLGISTKDLPKLAGFPPPRPDGTWKVGEMVDWLQEDATAQPAWDAPTPMALTEGAFHLYRHFDAAGTLLYVGISISALNRLVAHRQSAPWYWEIARIEVQAFATRQQSLDAERIAIQTEKPLHNIVHARP